jgi:hypothetical protein
VFDAVLIAVSDSVRPEKQASVTLQIVVRCGIGIVMNSALSGREAVDPIRVAANYAALQHYEKTAIYHQFRPNLLHRSINRWQLNRFRSRRPS